MSNDEARSTSTKHMVKGSLFPIAPRSDIRVELWRPYFPLHMVQVRWHIETFFRELKSRMQLGCYVLMKFEAVERYLDLLLMGFVLLEQQRLRDLERAGPPAERGGEEWVHARTTDRLRSLEALCDEGNAGEIERRMRTRRGRNRLLKDLRERLPRVA